MRTLIALLAIAAGGAALAAPPVRAQQTAAPADITPLLDSLSRDPNGVALTPADVTNGARTIAAKEHIAGSAATWHGPLVVAGTVDGNAVAIGGDVTIAKGARVRGDVVSVGGNVVNDGGAVDGETRTISAVTVGLAGKPPLTAAQAMRRAVSLAAGWYLVLMVIGLGVLLIARPNLMAVTDAVRVQTMRAFLVGLLGEISLAPLGLLMVVALAITIIGIIAIPFTVVAFGAAVAGMLALGFLASALLAGQALSGSRNGDRSLAGIFQPLIIGLTFFLLLWVGGTAFSLSGAFGLALKLIAAMITWIALTTGFGAVLLTRAGSRTVAPPAPIAPVAASELEWQTPTPVTGVAAARRPTPAPRRGVGGQ